MNQRSDSYLWKFVDHGVAIIVPILAMLCGWYGAVVFDHEGRLSSIESSKYTTRDAAADKQILIDTMAAFKETLHRIDKRTPENPNEPPAWFNHHEKAIRTELQAMRDDITEIKERIRK